MLSVKDIGTQFKCVADIFTIDDKVIHKDDIVTLSSLESIYRNNMLCCGWFFLLGSSDKLHKMSYSKEEYFILVEENFERFYRSFKRI